MKESNRYTISKQRLTLAVVLVFATALVIGVSINGLNNQLLSGLPSFTDSFESIQISDEQVPLANQDVETSKSTTSKNVKLSKKSKKTYTKKLPDKVSQKTAVSDDEENLVIADTATKKEVKEAYKKNKKYKKVTTTITKTVTTTTYSVEGSANEDVSTSTDTTSKSVKLKSKAKKTYTKELPDKASTKTSVESEGNTLIQTDTIINTETKEKFTKGKKYKKVITTVTTTVVTSTYAMKHTEPETAQEPTAGVAQTEPADEEITTEPTTETTPEEATVEPANEEATTASTTEEITTEPTTEAATEPADVPSNDTAPALPEGKSAIRTAAPKADEKVLSAFESLGFTFKVDAGYQYTGVFDAKQRILTVKYNDDNVYHELGHFVAFASFNYDTSSAFTAVYNEEKSRYTGRNPSYVLKNSSEYFAESYRGYVLNKSGLKSERPKTYAAIETALGKITNAQLNRLKLLYSSIWK